MNETGMTPEEILEKAADILAERGWIQHKFSDDNGYCAMGAINFVSDSNHDTLMYQRGEATRLLAKAVVGDLNAYSISELEDKMRVSAGIAFDIVATWNDVNHRTAEDVILAMKEAAHHDAA